MCERKWDSITLGYMYYQWLTIYNSYLRIIRQLVVKTTIMTCCSASSRFQPLNEDDFIEDNDNTNVLMKTASHLRLRTEFVQPLTNLFTRSSLNYCTFDISINAHFKKTHVILIKVLITLNICSGAGQSKQ